MAKYGKRETKFLKSSEADKLKIMRESDDLAKLYYLNSIAQSSPEKALDLAKKANFEKVYKANIGKGGGQLPATIFKGSKGSGKISYPSDEPEAVTAAKESALKYGTEGLKELMDKLRTPYTSLMNQKMEQMFGQLQNPIMQGLLYPERGNEPRGAMFPDRIEQEYQQLMQQQQQQNNPINQLMGALGDYGMQQHVLPWLQKPESWEQMYGYAEPGINRMYQGAGNIAQGGQDIWNYLRDPRHGQVGSPEGESIPAYFGRRALYGAAHPWESAQEYGSMMGQMGSAGLSGIQGLLSKLGNYIPGRGQQPQQ